MPQYDFKAKDTRDHPYDGRMVADSAEEVRRTLEARGFTSITVAEVKPEKEPVKFVPVPVEAANLARGELARGEPTRPARGEVDRVEGPDNPAPGLDLEGGFNGTASESTEIRAVMEGLRRNAFWFLAVRAAIFGIIIVLLAAGLEFIDLKPPDQMTLFSIAIMLMIVQFALVRSARKGPLAPLAEWQRLRHLAQYRKAAEMLEKTRARSVFLKRVLPEGYYHGELAILYAMDGDRSRAMEEISRAEATRLPEPFLSYRRATVLRALKEYADAELNYKKALEIDPTSSMLRAELALLYLEAGRDFDRAEELLKEALGRAGSSRSMGLLRGYLGAVFFREGRIDEADRNIEEGLRNLLPVNKMSPLAPVTAELFYYRALVQKALGHKRRALRALKQARKNAHNPDLISRITNAEKEIRST